MPLSYDTTRALFLAGSSMSLACSAVLVGSLLASRRAKWRRVYAAVFFMSACDFVFALKYFLPAAAGTLFETERTPLCVFEAVVGQFFGLASASWHFIITANTLAALRMSFRMRPAARRGITWRAHAFVWSLSAGTTAVLAARNAFGPSSDGTCWVPGSPDSVGALRLLFYMPISAYIGAALVLLGTVACRRSRRSLFHPAQLRRMVVFAGVFVAGWMWPCATRWIQVLNGGDGSHVPPWILAMHDLFLSGTGAFNFAVWCSSPGIRDLLFCGALHRARLRKLNDKEAGAAIALGPPSIRPPRTRGAARPGARAARPAAAGPMSPVTDSRALHTIATGRSQMSEPLLPAEAGGGSGDGRGRGSAAGGFSEAVGGYMEEMLVEKSQYDDADG